MLTVNPRTGTPGVGKTTLSEEVARKTGLKHINVSELVKQKGIGEKSTDAEDDTIDVDDDRLLDVLEVFRASITHIPSTLTSHVARTTSKTAA
jgi:broad-specificity NMP kinase